jgi:DNA helicase-2/ATP-dependent DNA helicase PcrA
MISNPRDDLAFARVVNVPARGVGATTLERLTEYASARNLPLLAAARQGAQAPGVKDRAAGALRDFVMLIDELTELRDHPAEEVVKKLLALSGYHDFLADENRGGGEDRLANLEELVSAAREFDREHPGASVLDYLEEITLASAVDSWNESGGSVALMTLHAAKGLEFPVVFIVGLEQGLLPHARSQENPDAVEEERRLFFVGITRARRELYLSHCRYREFRGSSQVSIPSRFLSELPEEALAVRDLSDAMYSFVSPSPAGKPPARPAAFPGVRLTTAAALAGAPASAAAPPGDLDAFQPGVTVMHPEYGLGRISSIDGAGPDRKGRVKFTVGPERTFVLAKSSLRPITRGSA